MTDNVTSACSLEGSHRGTAADVEGDAGHDDVSM